MSLRIALFYHSLLSDWNHGNAHFLRGVVAELQARGHHVQVYEPEDSWSRANLIADGGPSATQDFEQRFPALRSTLYQSDNLRWDEWLDGVDLAIVHEWNAPDIVSQAGLWRSRNNHLKLLFHDTHHRAVTAPHELSRFDLAHYDGVLAYGASLRDAYERLGWGRQVHVWHEAADTRVFYPRSQNADPKAGDLVWIGNWGDEERTEELREYFLSPVRSLGLRARVHGVRYPPAALSELKSAGIEYGGWLPNYQVPEVFACYTMTIHVPRRPYVEQLPGIPTIRPFEALACGIPLISSPWSDSEGLFRVGKDFLMAQDGEQMRGYLHDVKNDGSLRQSLRESGLQTIRARHTCAHRVDELLGIYGGLCQ